MMSNIKKYFKYGNWGYFTKDESRGMGNIVSLIRAIYNDSGYKVVGQYKVACFNDIKKQYTQLIFMKKNNLE